jgi:hypothetical protein
MFNSSKIHITETINPNNYIYNSDLKTDNKLSRKAQYILGCHEYNNNIKSPLYCKILKKIGICYMLNKYFKIR